ncbi:hypothetical protein [Kribbia dieselivorans]|uniref:hypothetical protein n=1 Tax=Kribbia dieselivorans TaxID=331526 RepID=UPI000839AD45|nr:hypothetical protein [Kribbia dieselivorans]
MLSHLEVLRDRHTNGVFRSAIYELEDGSEKTASSYLIGMAVALAVCRWSNEADALLHYDSTHSIWSGTRPDLVAAHEPKTHFIEVKGRYEKFEQKDMDAAVAQLTRHPLSSRTRRAAAIATRFRSGRMQVHRQTWHTREARSVSLTTDRVVSADLLETYEPVAMAIREAALGTGSWMLQRTKTSDGRFVIVTNDLIGLTIGLQEGLLDRVTGHLSPDGLHQVDSRFDLDEPREVDAEELPGRWSSSDLFLAWSPDTTIDEIGRHDD